MNEIKILISTDNHLGYLERDPVRGDDSFKAFQEVFEIAKEFDVDMILLGGDLFHDNKPSRSTLYKTMNIIRQNCFGNRKCDLKILSDQAMNFPSSGGVNFQDPNINISLPIFSIHGNHDDPTGEGNLCSLDLLSSAGLVNYFGKVNNVDDISIFPLLLSKGNTKLAIYGMGSVRDERLHRAFLSGKVKLLRPDNLPGVATREEWFNLFVMHQNRAAHGSTNFIPEHFLDGYLDLVFWGHEHECRLEPELNAQKSFYVTQPGSTVATSLCSGESVEKNVGILKITGKDFEILKIQLRTCRPFVMREVSLQENNLDASNGKQINSFLNQKVEEMINEALKDSLNAEEDLQYLPLIRLRVEYSGGYSLINAQRFGQKFVGRVANPNDILSFYRKRSLKKTTEQANMFTIPEQKANDHMQMDDLINEYLSAQKLDILAETEITRALKDFVEKDHKDALSEVIRNTLNVTRTLLADNNECINMESITENAKIEKERRERSFTIIGEAIKKQ